MRSFEDRKAEIFRRSAERIRRRKKVEKQLLGIGIPVVCVAVCLGLFFGRGNPDRTDTYKAEDQLYAEAGKANAPAADASVYGEAVSADAPAADAPLEDHEHADAPAEQQPWEIPPENLLTGTPGETFTEYEGIYVLVDELRLSWGSLTFDLWNQSGEYVHFNGHDLVRREDGQWVSCAIDGSGWQAEPMEIPPYEDEMAVGLSTTWKAFDFTQPGVYRYICTFRVGEDETMYTMWAEFTLEEGA